MGQVVRIMTTNYVYRIPNEIQITRYTDADSTMTIEFAGAGGKITLHGRESAISLLEVLKACVDAWPATVETGTKVEAQ